MYLPADPTAYGCTSWDSCTIMQSVSGTFTGVTISSGDNDEGNCASTCQMSLECYKTKWDATYLEPCCFGAIAASDPRCAPGWCPADPQSECTALFTANCVGASSCGRHKFLTPSQTADMGGAPCNMWYLNVKDNAILGQYWVTSVTVGSVTSVTYPSISLDPLLSVTAEISRYCAAEGASSGECSCYNAYEACTDAASGGPGCLIAADTGGPRSVVRRVDVYCNGGFSTTTEAGAWVTLSSTCDAAAAYGSPTINPASSNPYAPPGGVNPFPAHCWLPACQMQSDDCIFKNLPDLRRACPPICMQFASGNSVVINGTTTPAVHINVDDVSCGGWNGVSSVSATPYAWPTSEFAVVVPVGHVASFSIPLTNTSQDTAAGFNTMSTDLFSTLEPVVTLPQAAGNPLPLPNGSVTAVWVSVDAGALFPAQYYEGMLAAVDHTKANAPGVLAFTLDIGGPDDTATLQLGSGAPVTLPTTPSTRPPTAAPSVANYGSVQMQGGGIAPPHGARGQARVPRKYNRQHERSSRLLTSNRSNGNGAMPWWGVALLSVSAALLVAALAAVVWRQTRRRAA